MAPAQVLRRARSAAGITQAELARRLEVSQPEIARLESPGANPRFDTLEEAIAATGHELELAIAPDRSGIDETQIRANLKLSPAERLDRLTRTQRRMRELTDSARFRRSDE
jgi:transcriptional regulator with XRE-family HTH domain